MPSITLTDTTPGSVSDANANLNNNWTLIENLLNGGLDAANLAADAVGNSELAPNAVTDTEVAAAADIAVSKLEAGSVGSVLRTASGPTPTWLALGSSGALLYAGAADVAYTNAPTAGQVLRAVGTTPTWQNTVVAFASFVADVAITATTDATAETVISAGPVTYAAVPHLIAFSCPHAQPAATAGQSIIFTLWDGATDLGRIGIVRTPAANTLDVPVHLEFPITPTAAEHTYIIKALVTAGTGIVNAGAGGTGVDMPGYIRITRV